MDYNAERKKMLQKLIDEKKKFFILDDSGRAWMDIMVPDASNEFAFRFIAKFNSTTFNILEPTFGSIHNPIGLVMVTIGYDKILGVVDMDVEDSLLEKLKTEYPGYYDFWKNSNKVEGANMKLTN